MDAVTLLSITFPTAAVGTARAEAERHSEHRAEDGGDRIEPEKLEVSAFKILKKTI